MIDIPAPVVLASASPARRELLGRLVGECEVVPPDVCEESILRDRPEQTARARAVAKARAVARIRPGSVVIGADTVVACGGELMGKAADAEDALAMLRKLTRHAHRVLTALCVVSPDGGERTACEGATVRMRELAPEKLQRLARRPGALRWAGAYALQPDDPNVLSIEGCETTVMGLPLDRLERMLLDLLSESK